MGPVIEIKTTSGKWFSSLYALFSGVAFITNIGVLIAPIAHRFFHKLHLEDR
jgi:ABC-type polysaccharide/polyol phosphate export permease